MPLARDRMLEAVAASPECVARHDKQAWLALFTADAVVEDPVGSAPHHREGGVRGDPPEDEIGRFWETFIAPNEIRFDVREDFVADREVLRDVVIHTTLATGLQVAVPAHVLYELAAEAGRVRIRRLAAHWELPRLSAQALRSGWAGAVTLTRLGAHMLRVQGFRGTLGYTRALVRGIGGRGRNTVLTLAAAVREHDSEALHGLFAAPPPFVEWPVGRPLALDTWLAAFPRGTGWEVEQVTPAGWATSFRFAVVGADPVRGIGLLGFDPASRRLVSARFFLAGTG